MVGVGVGRQQWRSAKVGRRAAPLVALGRRTVAMMAAVLPMMTIILSEVIIIFSMLMLPRGMDVDGTKPVACRGQ